MPGTTRAEIRTLKVGRYVAIDEDAYKILSMSKSKPGKHGSAKARIELEDIFTGQKRSHVGTVTDTINIPLIEKGSATQWTALRLETGQMLQIGKTNQESLPHSHLS